MDPDARQFLGVVYGRDHTEDLRGVQIHDGWNRHRSDQHQNTYRHLFHGKYSKDTPPHNIDR
ncbi:hypothetical protein GCM10009784_08080 [Arthrobacter parietis]|uniref:Uncharacterized protein n=1 Tax=Arthrobacter parietis TaxID=271434 RepID=A0ABP5MK20_9MICC